MKHNIIVKVLKTLSRPQNNFKFENNLCITYIIASYIFFYEYNIFKVSCTYLILYFINVPGFDTTHKIMLIQY